jgi:hypothetical protein
MSYRVFRTIEKTRRAFPTGPMLKLAAHHMKTWPVVERMDGRIERTCEHGTGHPDPTYLDWVESAWGTKERELDSVHGCDGCCDPGKRESLPPAHTATKSEPDKCPTCGRGVK